MVCLRTISQTHWHTPIGHCSGTRLFIPRRRERRKARQRAGEKLSEEKISYIHNSSNGSIWHGNLASVREVNFISSFIKQHACNGFL